jgi:hypothetical protein
MAGDESSIKGDSMIRKAEKENTPIGIEQMFEEVEEQAPIVRKFTIRHLGIEIERLQKLLDEKKAKRDAALAIKDEIG